MLAKEKDEESDAAFEAYWDWLCNRDMATIGGGGGGGWGGNVIGADQDYIGTTLYNLNVKFYGYSYNRPANTYYYNYTGEVASWDEVYNNYVVPNSLVSASGKEAQEFAQTYLNNSEVSQHAIGGMPPPERPDLGPLGNTIRDRAGSDFAKDLFEYYWQGRRDPYVLSLTRFIDIVTYAAKNGAETLPGKSIKLSNGEVGRVINFSFYSSSEYNTAFGTATLYFNANNDPFGFFDTYDFNAMKWGSRSISAELKTRAVSSAGGLHGAVPFIIRFP